MANEQTSGKIYTLHEVAIRLGIDDQGVLSFVHKEWIWPAVPREQLFDDEDLARARMIKELKEDFGANDESIPIILHLFDQLHGLHAFVLRRPAASAMT